MHQLGPLQRVPSLVEARRASLAKSDTLFTHPYPYHSCYLSMLLSSFSTFLFPWSSRMLSFLSLGLIVLPFLLMLYVYIPSPILGSCEDLAS